MPLIETETLQRLVAAAGANRLALLTVELADARGYGRIVRAATKAASGAIVAIVEEKDASAEQRAIREIYTGVMAAPTRALKRWLAALRNDNAAGEYYLTDVVASAVEDGVEVVGVGASGETEVLGVNSPAQLADLERRYQRVAAARLMAAGVRLADPARIDQRGDLRCGSDVEIDVGCIFEGSVELGDGVRVGAYCVLRNARIDAGATIRPYTYIDGESLGASVGPRAIVGPYSRLRGGAVLGADVHVGNFVEIKNSTLGAGAKANHLVVPRRQRHRRARQLRCRQHHRQLRRRQQAPDDDRRRRAHRQQLRAGRTGHDRRGRDDRRRLHDQQGRARRRADRRARAPGHRARLEAAGQALTDGATRQAVVPANELTARHRSAHALPFSAGWRSR